MRWQKNYNFFCCRTNDELKQPHVPRGAGPRAARPQGSQGAGLQVPYTSTGSGRVGPTRSRIRSDLIGSVWLYGCMVVWSVWLYGYGACIGCCIVPVSRLYDGSDAMYGCIAGALPPFPPTSPLNDGKVSTLTLACSDTKASRRHGLHLDPVPHLQAD